MLVIAHALIKSKAFGISSSTLVLFSPMVLMTYVYFINLNASEGIAEAMSFLFFAYLISTYVTGVQRNMDKHHKE